MRLAIMLFTRDLRVHDNPALDAAVRRADGVAPLFVLEDRLVSGPLAAPNRVRFLLEAVDDLRSSLRERGGDLVIRRGDTVAEVIGLARDTGAGGVFCAGDVSGYAAGRQRRLSAACQQARLELVLSPGVTVVPPAELRPSGGGEHYRVFTPYLHFGCLSPLQLAETAGPGEFTRQLAWRDFFHQVTAAFPAITTRDYRPGRVRWRDDREAFDAWREGRTGVPIVDAGMRQLQQEGWMHNRARMIVASLLCKQLHIDWRLGARHFMDLLADGDIANNYGNWQWAAGTGNDTRPGRVLSPLRQATRFDAAGDYVRRYVPELAGLDAVAIRRPWTLPESQRRGYPAPIVEI